MCMCTILCDFIVMKEFALCYFFIFTPTLHSIPVPWESLVCFGLKTLRMLYEWNHTACNLWSKKKPISTGFSSEPSRSWQCQAASPFLILAWLGLLPAVRLLWVSSDFCLPDCFCLSEMLPPLCSHNACVGPFFFSSYCTVVRCLVLCLPPQAFD